MKMVFSMNGSKKRTLESFYPKEEELRENTKIINKDKQLERQITFNTFKINMIDRLQPFNNCSSCGK
jgi:hypothetical protein